MLRFSHNLGCLALPRPSLRAGLSLDRIAAIQKTKQSVQRRTGSIGSAIRRQNPPKRVSRRKLVRGFCWDYCCRLFVFNRQRIDYHITLDNACHLILETLQAQLLHLLPSPLECT